MTRFYVSDFAEIVGPTGKTEVLRNAKVYLFAFGTGTTHAEPTIPTGTAVTGAFFNADSGGSQLNSVNAWGPITTDANGKWEAYFATQQRIDAVYSSVNGTAIVVGTTRAPVWSQYKRVYDMTSPAVGGGTTTIALQDEAAAPLGAVATIQVIGADVDVSSSTAVWNAVGQATDYVLVQEQNSNWAVKRKDANQHKFANADAAVVVTAAAEELRVAGIGGSIAWAGFPTCTSAIRIDGDGIHMWGPGVAKQGDLPPGQLKLSGVASPYVGGLGDTAFMTVYGASCGIHHMHVDADNLAKRALYIVPQPTTHPQSDGTSGSDQNAGNHFKYDESCVMNGTEYGTYWSGADGLWNGGECRMGVGGDGTHGVATLYNDGGNLNMGGPIHIHGSGKGAAGRVAILNGHSSKFSSVHFEAGNGNDCGWNVEYQKAKQGFAACIFGNMEAGGELYGSGTSDASLAACIFMPEDLGANNTYDMIRVDSASALEMAACQAFIDNAGNNWRYALSKAAAADVVIVGTSLRAVTGAWDNEPTSQIANTLEDVAIAGNAPTLGTTKTTLTDAATVTVNAASGSYQTLATSASRAMGAPSNAVAGRLLTIEITAGAAVLPTWNAAYSLVNGAGPAIPNGGVLSITFQYNGSNWIEKGRALTTSIVDLTDVATVTVNAASGEYQRLSTANSRAFGSPSNSKTGQRLTLEVTNTAVIAITPTYNAVFKLVGGAGPTLAAGKVQSVTFRYNGTNWMEINRTAGDI